MIELSSSEDLSKQQAQSPPNHPAPLPLAPSGPIPQLAQDPATFVWQPVQRKMKKKKNKPLDGSQGYRTIHLHHGLFSALRLELLPQTTHWAAYVAVVLYRHRDEQIEILLDRQESALTPVTGFFLTHNIFQEKWTHSEATDHMVNETMLSLRRRIILKEKHQNPLKRWTDAHWHYSYSRPTLTSCMVTFTVLIPYLEEIFTIRDTVHGHWQSILGTIGSRWPNQYSHTLVHWDLSQSERMSLLGTYPPENIPEVDVSWDNKDQPSPATSWSDDEHTRSLSRLPTDANRTTNAGHA